MSSKERLPLGAVRTAEGDVVVPASKRADGSTRKPIRIRQGYVPQDEVPKYKTVAQRRREQEAKRAAEQKRESDDAVDALGMDELMLEQKKEMDKRVPREELGRRGQEKAGAKAATASEEKDEDHQQQLKRQLTKINKQLKEMAKLGDLETSTLSAQQKQKLGRKETLQQERNDIIAELNGATVTRSSGSSSGSRTKVAISL